MQNSIANIIFVLVLLSGATASTANADDVQDYIDSIKCDSNYPLPNALQEECDKFEQLRNCQASSAVSFSLKLWSNDELLYSYFDTVIFVVLKIIKV